MFGGLPLRTSLLSHGKLCPIRIVVYGDLERGYHSVPIYVLVEEARDTNHLLIA